MDNNIRYSLKEENGKLLKSVQLDVETLRDQLEAWWAVYGEPFGSDLQTNYAHIANAITDTLAGNRKPLKEREKDE